MRIVTWSSVPDQTMREKYSKPEQLDHAERHGQTRGFFPVKPTYAGDRRIYIQKYNGLPMREVQIAYLLSLEKGGFLSTMIPSISRFRTSLFHSYLRDLLRIFRTYQWPTDLKAENTCILFSQDRGIQYQVNIIDYESNAWTFSAVFKRNDFRIFNSGIVFKRAEQAA